MERIEKVWDRLPAIPESYGPAEIDYLRAVSEQLVRDRTLDEVVWALALDWAYHRAECDRLHALAGEEGDSRSGDGHFMTATEQKRAFHENRSRQIERELFATPYARAKTTGSAQTSFMDILDRSTVEQTGTVTPLRPLARRRGAGR